VFPYNVFIGVVFIAIFLLHIRCPLMKQKIVAQEKALEIAMKLESSPIGEISAGMAQVQSQLYVLTIQIQ